MFLFKPFVFYLINKWFWLRNIIVLTTIWDYFGMTYLCVLCWMFSTFVWWYCGVYCIMQSFKWYSSVYLERYIYLIFNRNARGQYNMKHYLTNIWIPISGPSHLHNGNIFSSKTVPLYWIVPLVPTIRWANNGPQCWLTRSMINSVHFYYIFPELVCVIGHCLKCTLGSWIKRMRYIVMLYRIMN